MKKELTIILIIIGVLPGESTNCYCTISEKRWGSKSEMLNDCFLANDGGLVTTG